MQMSGSHSMVKLTRTTAVCLWRTLVKGVMPCSAWLTKLLVADLLPLVTGSFPMELELVADWMSTEPEVRWEYFCTAEEEEWMESTVVRYLMQWMLPRPYTSDCTQQMPVLVSNTYCCSSQLPSYCSAYVLGTKLLDIWNYFSAMARLWWTRCIVCCFYNEIQISYNTSLDYSVSMPLLG